MNQKQNIVLIPAYEPGPPLISLLEDFAACGSSIVVVDDGSGEAYASVFEAAEAMAVVLTHKENRGKGAALKTGLAYIEKHSEPDAVIVTVDADGQHRTEDVMKMCEAARKHPGALILGGRKFTGDIPLRSRFGNTVTRFVYRISTGLKVYDTQTGLRAFHNALLPQMLEIPGDRYEYEMNVLLELAKAGVPIIEEEIATIYLDNNSSSHFDTVRDSFRVYREILRFTLRHFRQGSSGCKVNKEDTKRDYAISGDIQSGNVQGQSVKRNYVTINIAKRSEEKGVVV